MTARRAWTDEELGFIQSPPRGWNRQDIAEYLGRTVEAVKHCERKIARGWVREREPFTADDWEFIADTLSRTAADVGAELGRSSGSVEKARARLRARGAGGLATARAAGAPHHVGSRTLLARTCIRCGLLWGGGEFHANSRGRRHPACRRCSAEVTPPRSRKSWQATYVASMESATRSLATKSVPYGSSGGEPWTERDVTLLSDPALTTPEIAAALGRTWLAVQSALHAYGVRRPRERATQLPTGQWRIEFVQELRAA